MKRIIVLPLILVAIACQPEPESLEAKQKLLGEKQKELASLKEEIKQLKKEVAALDTNTLEAEATPVVLKKIAPENFEHFVKLTGTVDSKENVELSAEAPGRIKRINVSEGQRVSNGAILVELDNDAAFNQLEEAKAGFDLAKTTYERRKRLWDQKIGSEIEYLQAENQYKSAQTRLGQAKAQYENTIIISPIDGTVDNIGVNVGEFVGAGTPIGRVVDLDKVEVEAELSEEYLPNVKKGDMVTVDIPALGVSQEVAVSFVSQVINPDNRSFMIKVKLDNKGNLIKPNVLADVIIRDYQNKEALVVPSMAISRDLKGDFVFVSEVESGKRIAHKRYVKTGRAFKDKTEVKEGLKSGDEVIVIGYNEVNEGTEIALK